MTGPPEPPTASGTPMSPNTSRWESATLPTLAVPDNWDEASQMVAGAYYDHTLTRLSRDSAAGLTVGHATLGPIRLALIEWGADVTVDSAHPGGYAVNVPLSGHLGSVTRGVEVVSSVGQATICPPDTDTHIGQWDRDCRILGVGIDESHLQTQLIRAVQTGGPLPLQVDLRTPDGASWIRLVHTLAGQLAAEPGLLRNDLVADQLAGAVTTALILAAVPTEDAPAPRPRIVKRVLDALHADPGRVWAAGDMAECAGVGVRRLQEGFRQYVGRTPSECLLDIRLERVHADLQSADHDRTVTEIARHWGFAHHGRFAAAYRARYGLTPSQSRRG